MILKRLKVNFIENNRMPAGRFYKELTEGMSAKELQVLELLVQGMNTSQISKYLSESYASVAGLNTRIMSRLKVKSVHELRQVVVQEETDL